MTSIQTLAIRDSLVSASNAFLDKMTENIERGNALTAAFYAKRLITCERALAAVFEIPFPMEDSGRACETCDRLIDGTWYISQHKCDECHGRGCDPIGERCVYCQSTGLLACWTCDGTGEVEGEN